MSVSRENDREKNSCPSRGLGVAAAAIGVGVGAALYYLFTKRTEQPNTEGSTSDWNCERPQPFAVVASLGSQQAEQELSTEEVEVPRIQLTEEEQMAMIREQQFRERSWTLEDCPICFDVILRNQDVTQLPCTHNFHTECILPWLQERQTCPMCRKNAE